MSTAAISFALLGHPAMLARQDRLSFAAEPSALPHRIDSF
jgi:hypothetical protein